MFPKKGSHRITVQDVEYRWKANGNDGYISVAIWPSNEIGAFIGGSFRYQEAWVDNKDGSSSSTENQIVVTNRIVARIIKLALERFMYDPTIPGKGLVLGPLDELVQWDDAIRASH